MGQSLWAFIFLAYGILFLVPGLPTGASHIMTAERLEGKWGQGKGPYFFLIYFSLKNFTWLFSEKIICIIYISGIIPYILFMKLIFLI